MGGSNSELLEYPKFFKGLMFPIIGFKFPWRLVFTCTRCAYIHVRRTVGQMIMLVAIVKTTLQGSTNDIGWLLCIPRIPSVEDDTSRFKELLERMGIGKHMFPNTLVHLLVPSLFSNHGPLYFFDTKKRILKDGYCMSQ
jgi:hypothetical protein